MTKYKDQNLYHIFHESASRCQRCGECMTLDCPCGSLGPHQHFSNESEEPMGVDGIDYTEDNIEHSVILTLSSEREHTISIHVEPNVEIVLHGDGRVEYSVPPDEAAKAFWEAVEMFAKNNGITFHRS